MTTTQAAAFESALWRRKRVEIRKRGPRLDEKHRWGVISVGSEGVNAAFSEFVQQHKAQWQHEEGLGHFGHWPGTPGCHHDMVVGQLRRSCSALYYGLMLPANT